MSGEGAGGATPPSAGAGAAAAAAALDDRDVEPRTPMKRLGSTRKLAAFSNIRLQLCEQTRVLEARAEATAGVAGELGDYCRRRADLEHEYARALEKLARGAGARHEAQRQRDRREHWPLSGAYACWQAALECTRSLARDHAALAELYGGPLAARLQRAAEDALRLHRKCRDVLAERHEEVAAALAEAAAAGKAHAAALAAWRAAALKLRHAHAARADPPKHKKVKALDKELDKRRGRHGAARGAALRARAEYALALEAANATLQRYYLDDVADIILAMEVGFEALVGRTCRAAAAAEGARGHAAGGAAAALRLAADALDALADRQRLLSAHAVTFALPRPLAPPPPAEDDDPPPGAEPDAGDAERACRADLERRLHRLEEAARLLRAECRENAKTLDAAEAELVRQVEGDDAAWDVSGLFGAGAAGAGALGALPPPADDQEEYYLAKLRAYAASAGRLARVEGKAAALRGGAPPSPPRRGPRGARGAFSAPLDARLPRVLTECVRVIATYGLRHQGVFRVSGSVVETAALRAAFERGEEPLAEARDASDLNAVCGLLKQYLREVRPPLVPPQLQERLLRIAALPDDGAFAARLRATLAALPLPNVLVLRYLFAFLAHLADNSRYNMMDAWNLAICVGPTLLAAWGEGPHRLAAQNLVNELVKRTILLHERVFPQDVAPEALYRRPPGPGEAAPGAGPAPGDAPDGPDAPPPLDFGSDTDEETSSEGEGEGEGSAGGEARPRRRGAGSPAAEGGERGERRDPEQEEQEEEEELEEEVKAERQVPRDAPAPAPAPADAVPEPSTSHGAPAPAPAAGARRLAESTPDLVLDLPGSEPEPEPAALALALAASEPDPADAFAHNRDTLRKRAPPPAPLRSSSSASPAPPPAAAPASHEGSPVPGRHTARVAAQFAELTLTGGSLKPALAAKPAGAAALLRRPTPHPRHAAPAVAPAAAPAPE